MLLDQHNDLVYLANHCAWQDYFDHEAANLVAEDKLIDSTGQCLLISQSIKQGKLTLTTPISLEQFVAIVQRFAQLQGHCCSSKLNFSNFQQGFAIIDQLD
ncbi:DUF4144 domain-containing protein [Shewanella sp. OMA3-2]|uniref:DUF4144 domain-containing protein n=1 Tax=Shewanella sp. OMA3-2 TaxID=2908650 RepID=UPI001F2782FA|nr:DUF4144 domain-containing protein [Shewanella sp. OMA3-2]UJF21788.1 DUF4144 domain-containing protein [Shewanella sp. OMA3-2]